MLALRTTALSERIVFHAKSIGLNVYYLDETPGDGNCLYHSIIQGLNYSQIQYHGGHIKLRNDVVETVTKNVNTDLIKDWIQIESVENPGFDLERKLYEQRSIGEYADELFINGAAILLNMPILVTDNDICNNDRKYNIFWPYKVGEDADICKYDGPYVLLGNCKHAQHFQSLLFTDNVIPPWRCNNHAIKKNMMKLPNLSLLYKNIPSLAGNKFQDMVGNGENSSTPVSASQHVDQLSQSSIDFNIGTPPMMEMIKKSLQGDCASSHDIAHNTFNDSQNTQVKSEIQVQQQYIEKPVAYVPPAPNETKFVSKKRKSFLTELELQQECIENGVLYILPFPNEDEVVCKRRKKSLTNKIYYQQKNLSANDKEIKIQQKCIENGVSYVPPPHNENEDVLMCTKRRDLLTKKIRYQKNSIEDKEIKIKQKCIENGVSYIPPTHNEDALMCKKRRKSLNAKIRYRQNKHLTQSNNNNVIHAENDTIADINNIPDETAFDATISANPEVHRMMKVFADGELKHSVATCIVCRETRPIFHATEPSTKFSEKNRKPAKVMDWKLDKNQKCARCKKNINDIKKKQMDSIPTFSGHLTSTEDCFNKNYHNNMHFLDVPPFLKNLTAVEQLMIRKIIVSQFIHTLKYGMLASKGHAISIPQDMKVYKCLPLLPEEVGVLLIKNKNNTSKRYLAKRDRVQNALNGLIYGVPFKGVEFPGLEDFTKYTGKDHVDGTKLKGRYFKFCPNTFYFDVQISYERLQAVPLDEDFIDLPSMNIDSNQNNNELEDKGPAPDQFDVLEENEEIASFSGIVSVYELIDADKNLKENKPKLLGTCGELQ